MSISALISMGMRLGRSFFRVNAGNPQATVNARIATRQRAIQIESNKDRIVNQFERGVVIKNIARTWNLRVWEVEAILWERLTRSGARFGGNQQHEERRAS